MVTTVGPAVGAKAQFGYAEEEKWGYPISPPTHFFEFTSEAIASEFTNLVSAALRSDRAVHKQRIGTENAGGDVNFELGPEGVSTMLKHGLGKKRTKRRDIACVLVYTGTGNPTITIASTGITSSGSSSEEIAWTPVNNETCTQMMNYLNGLDVWSAYAPWGATTSDPRGYFNRTDATKSGSDTTCGIADFGYTHRVATSAGVCLLETCSAVSCGTNDGNNGHTVMFPLYYVYGIYDHTIETHADLPEVTEGLSLEIGRDIAAFNYYGAKINSLSINATPGEIVTGTCSFMAKGGSTCGNITSVSVSTGWKNDFVDVYLNSSATLTAPVHIDFDATTELFTIYEETSKPYYQFSVERGTTTIDGYYFDVTTLAGFLEFLQICGELSLLKKPGISLANATTILDDFTSAAITTSSAQTLALDEANNTTYGKPLIRGDYIGTDSGTSTDIHVKISVAGLPSGSAAKFVGSVGGSSWSSATYITYNTWHDILDADGADTGFDVMFPQNKTLGLNDEWKFSTFKDENSSATYATIDPFVGAEGAVTLDGTAQPVMGLSFSINNNLYGDKYELGDKQRKALKEQQMAVEGSINTEFDSLDLYRKFINGTSANMIFNFTGADYITSDSSLSYAASTASDVKYAFQLRFPNLKFSGSTPQASGAEIITTDFPFVALYDDTNSIPNVRITLTNHTSYI